MPRISAEKNREYQRTWYQKNKKTQIERNRLNIKQKQEKFREYKRTLFCKNCGFSHPAALDFHHRDPNEKENDVYRLVLNNRSWENIMAEIEKCDVLCANCHRIHHYNERFAEEDSNL